MRFTSAAKPERASYPKPHRLTHRATIEIIFEFDGHLLGHPGPLTRNDA